MVKSKGFTLIELMIVIAIVGILAATALGGLKNKHVESPELYERTTTTTTIDEDADNVRNDGNGIID